MQEASILTAATAATTTSTKTANAALQTMNRPIGHFQNDGIDALISEN